MPKKTKVEFVEEEVVLGDVPANIAYIGKGEDVKPLIKIHDARGNTVTLPENQDKPFYHESAGYIISHFPHLYKRVKEK